jgi:SAM-dependent methyltransferase
MFVIPSVDDWFQLARRYGRVENVEPNPLKHYGVFACQSFIEDHFSSRGKDVRILEVGHGFSPDVMSHFQDKHDVNGVDDDQKLHYFQDWDWDFLFDYHIAPHCKNVTFHRGLIGSGSQPVTLEEGSFDVIWSISILEEVKPEVVESIIVSAGRLLKPGGWLIGTHDLLVPKFRERVELHLNAHRQAGLEIPQAPEPASLEIDWRYALLEDPVVVMLRYEGDTPAEDRKFPGHYATMFTAARKPFA